MQFGCATEPFNLIDYNCPWNKKNTFCSNIIQLTNLHHNNNTTNIPINGYSLTSIENCAMRVHASTTQHESIQLCNLFSSGCGGFVIMVFRPTDRMKCEHIM